MYVPTMLRTVDWIKQKTYVHTSREVGAGMVSMAFRMSYRQILAKFWIDLLTDLG